MTLAERIAALREHVRTAYGSPWVGDAALFDAMWIITELEAELAETNEAWARQVCGLDEAMAEVEVECEAKVAVARDALRFYAAAHSVQVAYSNYPESRSYDVIEDDGECARRALAALGEA